MSALSIPTLSDFTVLLFDTLRFTDREFVAVCHQKPGGAFRTSVMPPGLAPRYAATLGEGVDVWFGVNPTAAPARADCGRGTIEQVTRLADLFADLDVKPGACADIQAAEAIIDELSGFLGQRPSYVVFSGHGLQPHWPLDDGAITDTFTTDEATALLRRFGRLADMVAENHHATVDNVFEPARVLRVPGTVNNKADPVGVTARRDTGGPLTPGEVDDRLTELGICQDDSDTTGTEQLSDPDDWSFARQTCPYVAKWIGGLATDGPLPGKGRNPWACSQVVRLHCAWMLGCISKADFIRAGKLLEQRLAGLLASTEPRRALRKFEMRDVFKLGRKRASCKTVDQARDELGGHDCAPPEPPPDVDDHHAGEYTPGEDGGHDGETTAFENLVAGRLHVLRINAEARRRLDDENRPPHIPPPIKRLDELLAEPDTEQQYRIDQVAPADARIMLNAQWKAGKTTLVGNLTRSLVDDEPFLGQFTIHTPAKHLVIIDDELSENTVRRWLRDQTITNTTAVHVITLRGKLSTFNLLDEKVLAEWADRLGELGCDYLILDCLRPLLDALGLDERSDAGQFLVAYDALLTQARIGDSLVVQHMGHANERARGDSRLQDWPDAIWSIIRDDDNPGSPRYFSAYGRDVNVTEGRLGFDKATRRLTYAAGSRRDAATEAALVDVVKLIAASAEPPSRNGIETGLAGSEHSRKAIRAALSKAAADELVTQTTGPKNAKLHTIAYPCAQCGMPVASKRERHQVCPPPDAADGVLWL